MNSITQFEKRTLLGWAEVLMERFDQAKKTLYNITRRKAVTVITDVFGGVGFPSKMPGTSWGLSTAVCIVGGRLREIAGTVCALCYADGRGNYENPSVQAAHWRRLGQWYANSPQAWVEAWVEFFDTLHYDFHVPEDQHYHRWFDSGDIVSPEMLGAICEIARRCPEWNFWLPTKELRMVREYRQQWGWEPDNLVIRFSQYEVGKAPYKPFDRLRECWATVSSGLGWKCPAPEWGDRCMDCRACWDKNVKCVDYTLKFEPKTEA